MNCAPSICIALLLLALSAGMFLLYKTQKEGLNTFFKVVSWFIIVMSLGCLICCGLRCVIHGCGYGQCRGMEGCEMGEGHFNKRVMIYKGHPGDPDSYREECEMECGPDNRGEEKGACCKGGEECGMDKEKCMESGDKCCKGSAGHEDTVSVTVKKSH